MCACVCAYRDQGYATSNMTYKHSFVSCSIRGSTQGGREGPLRGPPGQLRRSRLLRPRHCPLQYRLLGSRLQGTQHVSGGSATGEEASHSLMITRTFKQKGCFISQYGTDRDSFQRVERAH